MSHASEVPEARCLLVFCGSQLAATVTRASREAAEKLASENAILRRRGAPAFSHGQDPEPTFSALQIGPRARNTTSATDPTKAILPTVMRARASESVVRKCHVFAANLANCIIQGVEKQLNADLQGGLAATETGGTSG